MNEIEIGSVGVQAGQLARMAYKSGVYVGEVMELNGARALVKTLAVLKHPEQGDLHHPCDPDVPMFHQRRALSHTEKVNALTRELQPYAGAVPDYRESLLRALDEERDRLDRLKRWAEQGIRHLDELRGEY